MKTDILGWLICDPETGEFIMRCDTRAEARELAGKDGIVAVVRRYA